MRTSFFRYCVFCAAAFVFAVLLADPALAHRLNVFAWLENDKVLVECDFGRGSPARNASVTVIDSDTHERLLEGKTDAEGRFSFPVPGVVRRGHGLTIDVNSGQGHHNDWYMDASELYAAASLTAGFDEADIKDRQNSQARTATAEPPAPTLPLPQAAPALTPEHIKSIMRETLENQLGPIRQQLAAQAAKGPTMSEILGGIGWIIGLAGIFLYFKSRK